MTFIHESNNETYKLNKEEIKFLNDMRIIIESENNFNTAAGLASSSSGLSCLGFALATLFGLPEE